MDAPAVLALWREVQPMTVDNAIGVVIAATSGVCAVRGWYLLRRSTFLMFRIDAREVEAAAARWFAAGAAIGLGGLAASGAFG